MKDNQLKTAHVKFDDMKYNYSTSVNGQLSDKEIKSYFVNTTLNVGVYPSEIMRKCIGCVVSLSKYGGKVAEVK